MKILISPDSFKESLNSTLVAETILKTFKENNETYKYKAIPISDGGEGLLSVLPVKRHPVTVKGPFFEQLEASIGFLNDEATIIIEMARAAGIEKIKNKQKNANLTTTYGVGELVIEALKYNPKKIIIGLGGSATNDLGIGALNALGIKFYDKNNNEVGVFGKDIFKISKVDFKDKNKKLEEVELILATDVNNPLLGSNGSTYIYGPQKGLKKEELQNYDNKFKEVSTILNKAFNKDLTKIPGSGAAGGIAYSLATCFNGKITSGFMSVYELLNISKELKDVDYLITAEGKFDSQSLSGKAPYLLAKKAKEINKDIKIILFTGVNELKDNNLFEEVIEINDPKLSLKENINLTKTHLISAAKDFINKI